jgi:hypothetical protein
MPVRLGPKAESEKKKRFHDIKTLTCRFATSSPSTRERIEVRVAVIFKNRLPPLLAFVDLARRQNNI